MSYWQPKSVLQLLLIGFLVVVAPLGMAILHTVQTLGDLSDKNRALTVSVVSLNREGQALQRDLLDLERRGRQYLALKNADLLELFQRERLTLLDSLTALEERVGRSPQILGRLREQLIGVEPGSQTETEVMAAFSAISEGRAEAGEWLTAEVDLRVSAHAQESERIKDSLLFMVLLMVLATLALMLFVGYGINRPVQRVAEKIRLLGEGELTQPVRVSGPKDIQALGRQLEWLRSRLDEIDQQKLQFLRHISHELKTPLANLREGSDLLAERLLGDLEPRQQEVVDIVQRNAIELQRLIENLLDYTQLPNQQLSSEETRVDELVSTIVQNYQITITNKQLALNNRLSSSMCFVDQGKLKVALDNLISNAVNYTPDNGTIEITGGLMDQCLDITIANSGEPIPEDEQKHLFKPFFQGSSIRRGPIKGSGIGLSVARECIDVQGGTIELVEHPDFAICFRLLCPVSLHT